MKYPRFLADLGIIPSKDCDISKNNPSLIQGQESLEFSRKYARQVTPTLDALQSTSVPGVTSVVEAMDTNRPNVASQSRNVDSVSAIEDEFNKKLVNYTATYKLFSESILKTNIVDKNIKQYFGQAVTTTDGNYSYINDYGYTHKYSTDAWANNNVSCPPKPINIEDDTYKSLNSGSDMGNGQPCSIAGKNIQNITTKEFAWVDIKGTKHIYSSDLWKNKNASCNIYSLPLNGAEYNAIPNGGNMTSVDTCMQLDIDPALWSQLMKENQELTELSKQLVLKLNSVISEDNKLQTTTSDAQHKLTAIINRMSNDHNKLKMLSKNIIGIDAQQEDAYTTQHMYYIRLMSWIFLFLIIIILIIQTVVYPDSNVGIIIIGIIIIGIIVKMFLEKAK